MDPLWYKDAIIYEVHVRAFFDGNDDGIGDFQGLTRKLDYLQDLGITYIWLLPFYPSPLRDDGYDIQNYRGVHPTYGRRRDFRHFVREAHAREIRVLTELVVNHTSDLHPWFQAARQAPAGSSKRNFYVWSDTRERYQDARVIFTDSETSNWTWDPVAKAYYWHRFFRHQPDLNFDNPLVRRSVLRVMRFWLDMGVDGLRLDAVPYLIEREGTSCENLAETHDVLREIRRELDAQYTDRVLLAEANQWPADVVPYFGDGDECHMAFHFPLMPRIFMAVKQEDRHPITDILRQTPDPPESCQWALFLRNHDEMTLEMVTDAERDYMYAAYAADPQMRLNLGIRRRLAPLVDNSRPRMELLTSLLLSLPGTPIVYYGDELGMGDNIYLGDRNGVRTPMQWTGDRNGGFSRADPAKLYAPPVMDPVYGYQAINVEAQERSSSSLLNWTRRLIALRKQYRTLGRGSYTFLYPENRKVLAYLRRDAEHEILVVANLSRSMQPVQLDLSQHRGCVPVELLGETQPPRIGSRPYFLTLGPHAFYWLELRRQTASIAVRRVPRRSAEAEALPVLMSGPVWETLLGGHLRVLLERDVLPEYLPRQRWFAGKARHIDTTLLTDWTLLVKGADPAFLSLVEVRYKDGGQERYVLPLVARAEDGTERRGGRRERRAVARISGARRGLLLDATFDDAFCLALLTSLESGRVLDAQHGKIRTRPAGDATRVELSDPPPRVSRGSTDQSNTSIAYGDRYIMKLFRRVESGPNPDVEIGRFLATRPGLARVPPFMGSIEYEAAEAEPTTLAMVQTLMPVRTNGWEAAIDELGRYFERAGLRTRAGDRVEPERRPITLLAAARPPESVEEIIGAYRASVVTLARRTAELHTALSSDQANPDFAIEPITEAHRVKLAARMRDHAIEVLELLAGHVASLPATVADKARRLLERQSELLGHFESLPSLQIEAAKTRVHGDYHLGQVLQVGGDFMLLDFEGEPARSLAERRAKESPLKDVAGMLRSLSYAAYAELFAHTAARPDDFEVLEPWAGIWAAWISAAFVGSYLDVAAGAPFVPSQPNHCEALLEVFVLDKALYELRYEMNNRPDWIRIPLRGLLTILAVERDDATGRAEKPPNPGHVAPA